MALGLTVYRRHSRLYGPRSDYTGDSHDYMALGLTVYRRQSRLYGPRSDCIRRQSRLYGPRSDCIQETVTTIWP